MDDCASECFDIILLPGGMPGAVNLSECESLIKLLKAQKAAGQRYGAICASPAIVLQPHGLLEGEEATCYPSFGDRLEKYVDEPVVVSGRVLTSQGPATALAFALRAVKELRGNSATKEVASAMLYPYRPKSKSSEKK